MRRSYTVTLEINGIQITEVVIDPHYEAKHSETINDRSHSRIGAPSQRQVLRTCR